jgi:hypothetical protein
VKLQVLTDGAAVDSSHLECDAVLLGEWFAATALGLPESTAILQNAGTTHSMTVSHLRRPEYSIAETARQTCT